MISCPYWPRLQDTIIRTNTGLLFCVPCEQFFYFWPWHQIHVKCNKFLSIQDLLAICQASVCVCILQVTEHRHQNETLSETEHSSFYNTSTIPLALSLTSGTSSSRSLLDCTQKFWQDTLARHYEAHFTLNASNLHSEINRNYKLVTV